MKLFAFITLIMVLCCMETTHADQKHIGEVKGTRGIVSIIRNSKNIPAYPGIKIVINDLIITGSNGAIGILLKDNTLLSMGSMSRLSMDKFQFEPAKNNFEMRLNLQHGTFVYLSGLLGKLAPISVDIQTPVGKISMLKKTNFMANFPPKKIGSNELIRRNSLIQ